MNLRWALDLLTPGRWQQNTYTRAWRGTHYA